MYSRTLPILLLLPSLIVAQNTSTIVCIAGQCIQGYTNTTIGVKLTAPGVPVPVQLLPGQYTTSTNPQLLHDILTSSSASHSSSPGFGNASSTLSLPLNLALQPGLAMYSASRYSGQAGFTPLPDNPNSNTSTPLNSQSLAIASNVWAAVNTTSNQRVIFWDSIPDLSQLPSSASGSLSLVDMQSSACSPSCSGSGVCTADRVCKCAPGITGSSCESCAPGFFGPTCQPCPGNCATCDEGITGSGRCLKPVIANAPSNCNCLNGVCGSDGSCTCNAGFTKADNGTACAKCLPGFFLTSTGDCRVCQLGCTQCTDGTGICTTCKSGFSQNANDRTKCDPPQTAKSNGVICPDGSFSSGNSCTPCSSSCTTCTGPTSNDCIVCGTGLYISNGVCVAADSNGICQGSNLIADNSKQQCDSCGAKCTACKIPGFNAGSTAADLQCTGCLPGFVLSGGKCIESCPSGTFLSSQDNLTCLPCDSSCGTCAGQATFCLTCPSNQLASNGKCVSSCPSNTFSSSGSCLSCHPDCSSCSGSSFNQCNSCPPGRPVLSNGRCLPVCSQTQFFDPTSSSCQACDSSCSSCSGPGPSNCLACSSASQVLRSGSCVSANCQDNSNVVPGLGVCLSELVVVPPQPSGTSTNTPFPTVSGLTTPTNISKRKPLEWWQILLMALGCAFIFLVIIWLFRRRSKKRQAKRRALFPENVKQDKSSWRWRLLRFGEKLFGHKKSKKVVIQHFTTEQSEAMKLNNLRAAEEARQGEEEDMVRLIGLYQKPSIPEISRYHSHRVNEDQRSISEGSHTSTPSVYSQVTAARHAPEPRQPMKKNLTSRFSLSTMDSDDRRPTNK